MILKNLIGNLLYGIKMCFWPHTYAVHLYLKHVRSATEKNKLLTHLLSADTMTYSAISLMASELTGYESIFEVIAD